MQIHTDLNARQCNSTILMKIPKGPFIAFFLYVLTSVEDIRRSNTFTSKWNLATIFTQCSIIHNYRNYNHKKCPPYIISCPSFSLWFIISLTNSRFFVGSFHNYTTCNHWQFVMHHFGFVVLFPLQILSFFWAVSVMLDGTENFGIYAHVSDSPINYLFRVSWKLGSASLEHDDVGILGLAGTVRWLFPTRV